jgi:hypothetical protein
VSEDTNVIRLANWASLGHSNELTGSTKGHNSSTILANITVRIMNVSYLQSTDHELIPARNALLRQCKVRRAEVIFVTIQRENIRPSKKEMNKAVTMFIMPDVWG